MKTLTALALLATTPVLAGCIIIDDDGTSAALRSELEWSGTDRIGSVYGADISADTVSFRVSSNGCTDESYFAVDVDEVSTAAYAIAIDRVRADGCDVPAPDGVTVSYSFGALGIPEGASVTVENPVRRR